LATDRSRTLLRSALLLLATAWLGCAPERRIPAPDAHRGAAVEPSDTRQDLDAQDAGQADAGAGPQHGDATQPGAASRPAAAVSPPASQPVGYDSTLPKPYEPRDFFEWLALKRGPDLKLIDLLVDPLTRVPLFQRPNPPAYADAARIGGQAYLLPDEVPFPEAEALEPRPVTIRVGLARSTFRSRTREEVMSAVQPFIDLIQREVNIRGDVELFEDAGQLYSALADGRVQMAVAHAFDYLMIRSWMVNEPDNGTVLLATGRPANPRTTEVDRDLPGIAGTSVELVVAADAPYQRFTDLVGKRLAVARHHVNGPAAFLTRLLRDGGGPPGEAFFASLTVRKYPKDAVIDVLKGKADVACVDQGTIAAMDRFYGVGPRLRTLAVSPRYNVDVLFTTLNNIERYRTQIELTQTQLTTLGKDPEGQEILFFFDADRWENVRSGDFDVPLAHFDDYLAALDATPPGLGPLLDPNAPIDERTYTRYGDE
jgi:ABC-type phosphate/phosphonate transport system substrate-binding protein